MMRNLTALAEHNFDLIVVGGGISGACVAREAALNGMKVALLEKNDFCSGTSHHSLKLIHGGIRYLQQFDFPRILESIGERRFWLRAAPHLVRPLRALVPTYGYGTRGRQAFQIACLIYNALGWNANQGVPKDRKIGLAHTLSKKELLSQVPDAEDDKVSGGAVWYDGQMTHADRVVLECVLQTVEQGGQAANYVKAEKVEVENGKVVGVQARCTLTDETLLVRAPVIVNAAGPWLMELPTQTLNDHQAFPQSFNLNLVLNWQATPQAFALQSTQQADSKVGAAKRLLFFTPWRDVMVAGTSHTPYFDDINDPTAEIEKISRDFLAEVNTAVKSRQFTQDDVLYTYWGFTPGDDDSKGSGRALKSEIMDHSAEGYPGLFSVAGIKFTTARSMAEKVLAKVAAFTGRNFQSQFEVPTPGGRDYVSCENLLASLAQQFPQQQAVTEHLAGYFGTRTQQVMAEPMDLSATDIGPLGEGLARHLVYSARHEMVQRLDDALVRRYSGVQGGAPSDELVAAAANLLGQELGWDQQRISQEISDFRAAYPVPKA